MHLNFKHESGVFFFSVSRDSIPSFMNFMSVQISLVGQQQQTVVSPVAYNEKRPNLAVICTLYIALEVFHSWAAVHCTQFVSAHSGTLFNPFHY